MARSMNRRPVTVLKKTYRMYVAHQLEGDIIWRYRGDFLPLVTEHEEQSPVTVADRQNLRPRGSENDIQSTIFSSLSSPNLEVL